MYLRGFVGEYLDGNKWVNLKGTGLSEARDKFYWLRQNGVYGESLLAKNNLEINGKDKYWRAQHKARKMQIVRNL